MALFDNSSKVPVLADRWVFSEAFDRCGRGGLDAMIREHAQDRLKKTGHDSWKKFIERADEGQMERIILYLLSIEDGFLEAILSSELTKACLEDEQTFIKPRDLNVRPAIYLIVPCRKDNCKVTLQDGSKTTSGGYGLTPAELSRVCQMMETYLSLEEDPNSKSIRQSSDDIDTAFGVMTVGERAETQSYPTQQRWLKNQNSRDAVEEFIKTAKSVVAIAQAKIPNAMDIPLPWCFYEVGQSIHGLRRAKDQHSLSGSNKLFGLYVSILKIILDDNLLIKDFGLVYPTEAKDMNFCEILMSVVCCSHDYQGGLNPWYQGGALIKGDPRYDQHWKANQKLLPSQSELDKMCQ